MRLESALLQGPVAETAGITRRFALSRHRVHPWRVTLFISNLANDGGAEVQSMELARALKARGWDISVVSMRAPKSEVECLRTNGIPVHTLNVPGWDLVRPTLRLARFLREERPHILHCHMSHAVLTARIARLVRNVPVVIGTLHGLKMYNVRGTGWRTRETLNGLTNWLSDGTTVVCDAAAAHYLSTGAVTRASVRLIPNGIATDRYRFDPAIRQRMRFELGIDSEFVWLMVGRFQPVKDHHTILRAFARLANNSPQSRLLLAGSGPLQSELEELAIGLGLGSKVRFLGTRADIPELLTAADACVLSSVCEASPMALLEAAATGLPCVTTDVGGTSDIVIHGVTGFLCPAANPEALAHAMLRLSALPPSARTRMGEQARRHVTSRFSMNEVVGQWEHFYHEMLSKKEVTL